MLIILIPFLLLAEDYKSQLEGVKKEIAVRKKEANKLKQKEKSILKELDQINRKISKSKNKLKELKNQEKELKKSIKTLELDGEKVDSVIGQQEKLIGDKVRLMYQYSIYSRGVLQYVPTYKISSTQTRTVFYMQQILKQDINWHANLKDTKTTLTIKEEEGKNELTKLLEIKNKEEKEQKEILAQSQKKEQILKGVKEEETQKSKLIKELEEARAKLEGLIAEVQRYPAKELGAIVWPVQGELINEFGMMIDPKLGTKLINKGIDIRAPYGTNVMAISGGKVVHEGVFLGYGKIILLDHRNGFCTLYGYLSETLVTAGDEITKGEVIGRVGTGSLADEPALHFELRKNGVAVDPLKWLQY